MYAYDYYDCDIPEDITDSEERYRLAFIMAEEQSKIYVTPCEWRIISDDGYIVRVCRKRIKHENTRHYHVLVGMEGGYLPDTNDVYLNKHDAGQGAKWYADSYRYDYDIPYSVTGNMYDGYYVMPKDASSYTLATLIEVTECQEKECLDYID